MNKLDSTQAGKYTPYSSVKKIDEINLLEKTEIFNPQKKRVTFSKGITYHLIDSKNDLERENLIKEIWFSIEEEEGYCEEGANECMTYSIRTGVDFKTAQKELYQPSPITKDV